MLDIEVIKWGCRFADGFEYKPSKYNSLDDQIRFSNGTYARRYDVLSDEWKFDKYGDFLQRVIEGVNKNIESVGFGIMINWHLVKIVTTSFDDTDNVYYWLEHPDNKPSHLYKIYTIDKAKEKAIQHIFSKIMKTK